MICVSLVSHGHGAMVDELVERLASFPEVTQILLTQNIQEFSKLRFSDKIEIIVNNVPLGFSANHNAAFVRCHEPFFCVLNPDIILPENPFPALLGCISTYNAAMCAPLVLSPELRVEDSFRYFPVPFSLFKKALKLSDGRYHVVLGEKVFCPDWIAGMFMLFDRHTFQAIGGFDQKFFLYYEDVDICVRLWKYGFRIVACPSVRVIHAAQRSSHRNWRFMRWHLVSMVRYFYKHAGRLPRHEVI